MGDIFGTPNTGPTEDQLRQQRIAQARKRASQLEQAAMQMANKGPQQLFGPGNPALRINNRGGNSNAQ